MNYLADTKLFGDYQGFRGIGPLGLQGVPSILTITSITTFVSFLSSVIGLLTIIGIIWFVILLVTGAIGIMTAGGDKGKMESARTSITNGLVGLVLLVAGLFILSLVGKIFGFDILNILGLFFLVRPL